MTLDSSALIAILFAEPNHLDLVDRILQADSARVSAPTLVETSMVFIARRGSGAGREVDELVKELGITVVPFGEPEWHAATAAFHKYGRGRHRASLNFGDCLAYATAIVAGDSLLFVGEDFTHTGITAA
jgi:ribonuclease VapC